MTDYAMLVFHLLISILITFSTALDTINVIQSIRDRNNETLVSTEGTFVLGFFSPPDLKGRYVGIWYKKVFPQTIVWVANRENPQLDNLGALNITSQGRLILLNGTNDVVWSSNSSRVAQNPIAQLLGSGNLVIRDGNDDNPENYLWQSFDYPCDTLLPGMKLGVNLVTGPDRFLSSWKSSEDPAPGQFSLQINPHGYPQLFLMKGSNIQFRVGQWNGQSFSRIHVQEFVTNKFVFNEKEVYYMFELKNNSMLRRLTLNPLGIIQSFSWNDQANDWEVTSTLTQDQCENYAQCGVYASCNIINSTVCSCLKGFRPKAPRNWSSSVWSDGCARNTPLGCNNMDRFLTYTGMKLPDTSSSFFYNSTSLKDCEQLCLKNCSCTAYANSGGAGSGCLIWFNELIDVRELSMDGQNLYVRVAASELGNVEQKNSSSKRKKAGIVASVAISVTGMLTVGSVFYLWRRSHNLQEDAKVRNCGKNDNLKSGREDMDLPIFEWETIADATNNFSSSNKLGEGGFGHVYKGTLMRRQEIAVKRLSKSSSQGLNEFMNEIVLIAKLQHRNLVKLLGCCIHGDEKMLIYEYMPNKSLDYFVFDQTRSKLLDWQKRIHIIEGIARGLVYLHQDSRLRIIHRDLKGSNILLDKDMNPKISDFGLARTFGELQTEANTNRVVGTYCYMSPEYVMNGLFSVKSDVFSFGVLVLEIVSGKRNRGFCHPNQSLNLLGHAWILWTKGSPLELIDECLRQSCKLSEVIRCIHVALLCVQQRPDDRPNMSSVVLMLGSENSLPQPKQPGFFMGEDSVESTTSFSANEVSMTSLEAR